MMGGQTDRQTHGRDICDKDRVGARSEARWAPQRGQRAGQRGQGGKGPEKKGFTSFSIQLGKPAVCVFWAERVAYEIQRLTPALEESMRSGLLREVRGQTWKISTSSKSCGGAVGILWNL